MSWNNYKKIMM